MYKYNYRIPVLGMLAIVMGTATCSSILDFTECRVDSDCANFFVDNQPTFCNLDRCEVRSCTMNADCKNFNDDSVSLCNVEGNCTVLDSACEEPVYPDDKELPVDEVVFVGSLASTPENTSNTNSSAVKKSIELAISELNEQDVHIDNKKVAWVHCDAQGDKNAAVRAAEFLVGFENNSQGIFVRALISSAEEDLWAEVVKKVIPRNVFMMSSTAIVEHEIILEQDPYNLVWQVVPSASRYAIAFEERIQKIIDDPDSGFQTNAALLYANNNLGYSFYQTFTEIPEGGTKRRFPLSLGALGKQVIHSYNPDNSTHPADAVKSLQESIEDGDDPFSLGFLIIFGGDEVKDILIEYQRVLGDKWPDFILIADSSGPAALAALNEIGSAEILSKFIMISPRIPYPEENSQSFLQKFDARFPGESINSPESQLAYDATVTTLMAMLANQDIAAGPQIAKSMERIVDSDSAEQVSITKPNFFALAKAILEDENASIDLQGASSNLNLDLKNQDNCTDFAAFSITGSPGSLEYSTQPELYTVSCPNEDGEWP